MYFLEQLVAEWYAFQGFFVRTNIKFGKRKKGGYEGEINVAAYNPKDKRIIHFEISTDADSWQNRKRKFQKKFQSAARHYKSVFDFKFRGKVEQVALVGFSKPKRNITFGNNIKIVSISGIIREIRKRLKELDITQVAVPEGYPLLRAIQFTVWFPEETN